MLDRLGLGGAARRRGARIDRLEGIAAGSDRPVLDVRYAALRTPGLHGVGIHRAALFGLLHDAVRAAGIAIGTGCEITGSALRDDSRLLESTGGARGPFALVVDAAGARSPLRPPAGQPLAYGALWASLPWPGAPFDPAALQQRYRAAREMAGVLPTGEGAMAFFWSLRADQFDAWRAQGLDRWKTRVRALWPEAAPILESITASEQFSFARYAHRTLRSPVEPRLIHLGDAWHSTSPQLGQGANMALLDAWALAQALREHESVEAALTATVRMRRRHIRLYQAMSLWLTPVYQSDGRIVPWLRDRLVGPLSKYAAIPRLQAAMVSGLIADPLKPLGLSRL